MSEAAARRWLEADLLPTLASEKARLDRLDRWHRFDHDKPYVPAGTPTAEYIELGARAQAPWGSLVVTTVAQRLFVEGYRGVEDETDGLAWSWWQRNRMDSRQSSIHRAALAYGQAFTVVTPGVDLATGEPGPVIRGVSPRRMVALYDDQVMDDWPVVALRISPFLGGTRAKVYTDTGVYTYSIPNGEYSTDLSTTALVLAEEHGLGVCPVVRYENMGDLEGRSVGEIEPLIPTLGRIDQTSFDRLVVQRFASWVVRTISGMDRDTADPAAEKLRLSIDSILISEDPETKFGSMPATPLDGFIKAHDADIKDLSALSQTPPHYLLGQMANLSAEALAAAEASLSSKIEERQHSFGESHEATLRLAGAAAGNATVANDFDSQVVWRDTQSRSLAQVADALVKLVNVGYPAAIAFEKLPNHTRQDIERITAAMEGEGMSAMIAQLLDNTAPPVPDGVVA